MATNTLSLGLLALSDDLMPNEFDVLDINRAITRQTGKQYAIGTANKVMVELRKKHIELVRKGNRTKQERDLYREKRK